LSSPSERVSPPFLRCLYAIGPTLQFMKPLLLVLAWLVYVAVLWVVLIQHGRRDERRDLS